MHKRDEPQTDSSPELSDAAGSDAEGEGEDQECDGEDEEEVEEEVEEEIEEIEEIEVEEEEEEEGEEEEEEEEEVEEEIEEEEEEGGEKGNEEGESEEEVVVEEMEEEEDEEEEREEEEPEEMDVEGGGCLSNSENSNDTRENIEYGGHAENLKPNMSTRERSDTNPASISHVVDGNNGNLASCNSSAELQTTESKGTSDINGITKPAAWDKCITSLEENRHSKSNLPNRDIEGTLGKKAPGGTPSDVQRHNIEARDSHRSHLGFCNQVNFKNTIFLQAHNDESVVEDETKGGPNNVKSNSIPEKEAPTPRSTVALQPQEDFSLSKPHPLQRRPRSPSPGASLGNVNKRPAIVCDFFARGWCIRGNSCRFLHQREGLVSDSKSSKEDVVGPLKNGDFDDHAGSMEEAERSKLSISHEPQDSLSDEGTSKLDLQRALVRAYGGDNYGSPHPCDDISVHTSKTDAEKLLRIDNCHNDRSSSLAGNKLHHLPYQQTSAVIPYLDSIEKEQSSTEDFLSRRHLSEGKLHLETGKLDFVKDNDISLMRVSSLARNQLIAEYQRPTVGSSTVTDILQKSNNQYTHNGTEDVAFRYQRGLFSFSDSYTSYGLTSSAKSRFDNSLHPSTDPSSLHAVSPARMTLSHGSTPLTFEHINSDKALEFDRVYHGSMPASLLRSCSPYQSRSEETAHQNNSRDLPASSGQKKEILENSWEPSVPFRSSFCLSVSKSSPGSQYDPLVDSIDPPQVGSISIQKSPVAVFSDVPSQHINGHSVLGGIQTSGYTTQKTMGSSSEPHNSILDKNTPVQELDEFTSAVSASGPGTSDGGNISRSKDEKQCIPHVSDGADINGADLGSNQGKESKSFKIFRAALVEFMKELLKPSWREGHLSRDSHKMIVKKAVEKVLDVLQPHQVPTTAESIDNYLSASKQKLSKLVEGYVVKYGKS